LGGILQRTFQSLEVVGRWGDAEFVVGMYGMSKDDGLNWLAEVLEILRQQVFTGSNRTKFQLTFSIGIAQYPEDGIDSPSLYKAADTLQQSRRLVITECYPRVTGIFSASRHKLPSSTSENVPEFSTSFPLFRHMSLGYQFRGKTQL